MAKPDTLPISALIRLPRRRRREIPKGSGDATVAGRSGTSQMNECTTMIADVQEEEGQTQNEVEIGGVWNICTVGCPAGVKSRPVEALE